MNVISSTTDPFFLLPLSLQKETLSYFSKEDLLFRISLVCNSWLSLAKEECSTRLGRLVGEEKKAEFIKTYKNERIAYFNFKKMEKEGGVISAQEIAFDGGYHKGMFRNGKLHGQGQSFFFVDGNLYMVWEGEFKNGSLNGLGKVSYADGTVYEGEFKDHALINGTMTDSNGERWEGNFKRGLLHGQGMKIYPDGRIEEGEFVKGELKVNHWCSII